MNSEVRDFCKKLDNGVDSVRNLTKNFREALDVTTFAYVRVYHDERVSWVTSDADHDRLLIDSGFLENDPLVNTAQLLKEGRYLWFHNREFPGCEDFYRYRSRIFGLDHGLVIVNHHKKYLETGVFSGLLSKKPLYNLFMNEMGLFRTFLEEFKSRLNKTLNSILEEGIMINHIKAPVSQHTFDYVEILPEKRLSLIASSKWSKFLKLSNREKECLVLVSQHLTYQEMGDFLGLSARTIEHYLDSVKNKLEIHSRAELYVAAQKMIELGLSKETH